MEKAKNIITSKKFTHAFLWVAIAVLVVAVFFAIFFGGTVRRVYKEKFDPEPAPYFVKNGDVLSKILTEHGLTMADANEIDKLLRKHADKTQIRACEFDKEGNLVKPKCDKMQFWPVGEDGKVSKMVVTVSPWRKVEFTRDETGAWKCDVIERERDTRIVFRHGKIADGYSFYQTGLKAGMSDRIIMGAYDLLAFEMDFERDIREGQEFFAIYEENYLDGKKVSDAEDDGRIIAVSFDAMRGNISMYRFNDCDKCFYDKKGNGATKSLKRTPINNAKITSNFSKGRKHPVLGFTRAHKGVDFRAPTGTPIPAAGAGRVVARGFNRGHGNFVKIRHNKSFETLYAHMSRFQKGVNVGTSVHQGQIIGYAGSTGLSTGPHLHYEIIKDGVHVNPLTVTLPPVDNLSGKKKEDFLKYRARLDETIENFKKHPTSYISKTELESYLPQ